jgi:hypothetical protein
MRRFDQWTIDFTKLTDTAKLVAVLLGSGALIADSIGAAEARTSPRARTTHRCAESMDPSHFRTTSHKQNRKAMILITTVLSRTLKKAEIDPPPTERQSQLRHLGGVDKLAHP